MFSDPEWQAKLDFYARCAKNAGVPEMWIEDAAQDIALAVWRYGYANAWRVHNSAIDAARRYGPVTRRGHRRDHLSLDELCDAPEGDESAWRRYEPADPRVVPADELIDLAASLGRMVPRARLVAMKVARGEQLTHAEQIRRNRTQMMLAGLT